MLVLAGPGAGKTFCLIERIRFLIDECGYEPARICAFTFTNRAAEEIATRLDHRLGTRADRIKRGTIHAFCAELLREFGSRCGLEPGFGIADELYQRVILRRLQVPARWHGQLLTRFALHRFRGDPLHFKDEAVFARYDAFLAKRNVVDFDMLVLKTVELLQTVPDAAAEIRGRWGYVLVDEFQDLNRAQYAVIRELARDHNKVFAVGDDEQSIYSWAGADRRIFPEFVNHVQLTAPIHLQENHRCPREVFALARRLVMFNAPIFTHREHAEPDRASAFPVITRSFATEVEETRWILDDLLRDREAHGLAWGDFALLYRKHEIGEAAEASFLAAGIPCRMAAGRAFAEDPIVAYVIAALRVIAHPLDDAYQEGFFAAVLPKSLVDVARARAEEHGEQLLERLDGMARDRPKGDEDARKIRRGFFALRNLEALGERHSALEPLVEELLSQRVGEYRTVLEEHYDHGKRQDEDGIHDPKDHEDVVRLADRLAPALETGRPVWLPRLGGVEIALKGLLAGAGFRHIVLGGSPPGDAVAIRADDTPSVGIALGVFKAAQVVASRAFTNAFLDFTAVDLETTGRDTRSAEIVDIAAVRVRHGAIAGEFHELVRPRVPIEPGAQRTHGISADDVATAPYFEDVWPRFRAFCGGDLLVAHNGYSFDFPILRRMARPLPGGWDSSTYDTLPLARELVPTSRKLRDLARTFQVDPGRSHHALDDTRTLARVFPALNDAKVARARATALVSVLDSLGIALALIDETTLNAEGRLLRRLSRGFALGRYTDCLERYRAERETALRDAGADPPPPATEAVIERLGGHELMLKVRADRSADDRYPAAMLRLRRLIAECGEGPLSRQVATFLERAVLSRWDEADPDRERVNLLTLHSTKGLEFSRVYVVGVEDAQMPGGSATKETTTAELEEARRLLYVGMTRAKERLVLTRVEARGGKPTGGAQFLDEMGLD